ncbi:hypothetical protein A3L22_30000 [Streptomyces griseus subsp. griseus]|nr:hypothetical protein A3L22_30000 [Streptomyces griseus subsp. griseus]
MSLAEAYPQVAATWFQERNGGLTPEKATPKMTVDVWWRCPAGHEWQERIGNRTSMPKRKNGEVAACRECVGYRVSYTYPERGCTLMVTPESAAKKKTRCWSCYQQWWQANEKQLKKELSAAAKAAAGRAGKLLEAVPGPADVPAPLVTEWRWWAARHLQSAIATEEKMGPEGRTEEMLAQVTEMAARLLPTKAEAGRVAAHGGVMRLLDQAHWTDGWLHQFTGRAARRLDKDDLENMAWVLGEILAAWSQRAAEAVAADPAKGYGPPSPAEVTRVLTKVVLSFKDELVRDSPLAPYPRTYKELRLPVVPEGKGRYGRADVVIWIPGGPNFVIEIDSAPNPASAEKLAFARDAGAFPLWVRFGKDDIEEIDGVMVLDIRAAVQSVFGAGAPE